MIAGLKRAWDNLFGLGEAAVTVPPLDGSLRPNSKLDEARARFPLENADCLVVVSGNVIVSSGNAIYAWKNNKRWRKREEYKSNIACIVTTTDGGLIVALTCGDIIIDGGKYDGRNYRLSENIQCITALTVSDDYLFVANGSAINSAENWQCDLMQRSASGSIWRIDLESGESTQIAGNLAYPAGLILDGTSLIYSEAWKHRLVKIDALGTGQSQILYGDMPGYPGRISRSTSGYWLAVFAPRSQLVEFVLRETAYCKRMISEVPMAYWIAPKFRSGTSFYESLQGGGVKHFGQLKPWAPTMSAGLCVKLNNTFQPDFSLHSRADGKTHGVTSIIECGDDLFIAAHGDNVVVSIPLKNVGESE